MRRPLWTPRANLCVCVCVTILWLLWVQGWSPTSRGFQASKGSLSKVNVWYVWCVSIYTRTRTHTHTPRYLAAHTQIWVMWEKRQTHIPAVPLKGKGIPKSWKITRSSDENPQKCFNMCHRTLCARLMDWLHANMRLNSSERLTAC